MNVVRKGVVVLVGCVAIGMLSACTGDADAVDVSPWSDDVRSIGQKSKIELVRGITEDGEITQAEFGEVQQTYVDCHADQGFPLEVRPLEDGLWSYFGTGGPTDEGSDEAWETVGKECSLSSGLTEIEPLYAQVVVNPDREDLDELVVECLVGIGAVDKSYTAEDYREDLTNPEVSYAGDPQDVQVCVVNPKLLLEK